ncbi:hypothetical protein G6F70_008702 [Rhizopus microsporus]|nr:hypothetical protein G6F71_008670 [Rhizopus microsporus]KAG1194829.1 hypothetical protein G6F70_008702 [Rhizopus microsporus]KAG1206630.1 hypothetical protein G6F69_008688 [Rhizopus microsporus]KAG1227117.1 hypothetical protein G6F67_008641 [Rhizopus microsporus]KAG1258505.1 hypothetical protein G6F68_008725 [Rhizopus microsporus]
MSTRPIVAVQNATTKSSTRSVVFQIHDRVDVSDLLQLSSMVFQDAPIYTVDPSPDRYHLQNRGITAYLNYLHIIWGHRCNGMISHKFHRAAVTPTRRQRRMSDQEQPRTKIRLDDDSPS